MARDRADTLSSMEPALLETARPLDDLVRVAPRAHAAPEIRAADDGDGTTLIGHFAVFDEWTEIDSWREGHFLERFVRGAFKKTIRENRSRMRCIYEHGLDFYLNNAPLGPIDELREDDVGAYYEVPLIDTDYNRDRVIPQAKAGLLGASFRFRVIKEKWENPPEGSRELPRRTVLEAAVYEFGPCPFAAYEAATAGLRSRGEIDLWRSLDEEGRAEFARLMQKTTGTPAGAAPARPDGAGNGHSTAPTSRRARALRAIELKGLAS